MFGQNPSVTELLIDLCLSCIFRFCRCNEITLKLLLLDAIRIQMKHDPPIKFEKLKNETKNNHPFSLQVLNYDV